MNTRPHHNLIPLAANEVRGEGRGEVVFNCPSPCPFPRASLRGEGSSVFDVFLISDFNPCLSWNCL